MTMHVIDQAATATKPKLLIQNMCHACSRPPPGFMQQHMSLGAAAADVQLYSCLCRTAYQGSRSRVGRTAGLPCRALTALLQSTSSLTIVHCGSRVTGLYFVCKFVKLQQMQMSAETVALSLWGQVFSAALPRAEAGGCPSSCHLLPQHIGPVQRLFQEAFPLTTRLL